MTKDMVPVLYHDWTVTETGLDIPVSSITLDQFQTLSASKSRGHGNSGSTQSSPKLEHRQLSLTPPPSSTALKESLKKPELPRRISHNSESDSPGSGKDVQNRLGRSNSLGAMAKLKSMSAASEPSDPKAKMKGNGLGTIQAPFATLKDTFEVQYSTFGMMWVCACRVFKLRKLICRVMFISHNRRSLPALDSISKSSTRCWMKPRRPTSRFIHSRSTALWTEFYKRCTTTIKHIQIATLSFRPSTPISVCCST